MVLAESIPIIAISGPTAAGKSQLALDLWNLACAGQLIEGDDSVSGAELISVDSAQIYRGMDIGTAKPDSATLAAIPHHLVDILDPSEPYSAARFAQDANRLIEQIRERRRIPILVGGTLLYYRALFDGLSELPSADPQVRARIAADAQAWGWPVMHQRLASLDPATGERLHPNDAQRIMRALELIELTGEPLSLAYQRRELSSLTGPILRYAVVPPDREQLHQRIALRFRQMVDAGLISEVEALFHRGDLHADLPSVRAVGYRQIWNYLEGRESLDSAIEKGIIATRQYAKRQLTWLRSDSSWTRMAHPEVEQVLAGLRATFHHLTAPKS